ncbi:alkaline phosphatase, partial [Amaricoccus sp. HAR-UPW-R2A-40]
MKPILLGCASVLALCAAQARAEAFNRIASFPVARNLPEGADPATVTSAEIVSATADGMTLVYTDSPTGRIGFVDIADPRAPRALGGLDMGGEPTSVT